MRGGGGAAQQLQKIERGALGRSAARGPGPSTLNRSLIALHRVAFGDPPIELHPRIDLPEGRLHVGNAAEDGRLARDDRGAAGLFAAESARR